MITRKCPLSNLLPTEEKKQILDEEKMNRAIEKNRRENRSQECHCGEDKMVWFSCVNVLIN